MVTNIFVYSFVQKNYIRPTLVPSSKAIILYLVVPKVIFLMSPAVPSFSLLGSWKLGPMWPRVGLHGVDHLLNGLLLVVTKLPVVLYGGGLCQHGVLPLVADLCLQLEVHVRGLEFGDRHDVVDGDLGTCESRVSSAQFRAGAG